MNPFWVVLALAVAGLAWTGCQNPSSERDDPVNPPKPFQFPGGANGDSSAATNHTGVEGRIPKLQVGELVTVTFHDVPPNTLQRTEQRIREDGSISLPYGVNVQAAGKTPRQLEDDIRAAYVPRLYLRMTPIVTAEERSFYVGGEVKISGRLPYNDKMTVLRAIQSAGDFTDFANRRKIDLIRANGEKHVINWYDAKRDSKLDLEVFPGDTIVVSKTLF